MIKLKQKVPQVGSKIYKHEIKNDIIKCDFENILVDFVITIDNELKFGHGHYKLSNKSEFVKYAGRAKIKDGKIIYIDTDSGHYVPTEEEMINAKDILNEMNLISNDIKLFVV